MELLVDLVRPNAAATACSLLPRSNIQKVSTFANASGTFMGSCLLMYLGMGGEKHIQPFVLYTLGL
jgi:hypothetical protein